uniref:A20-type domain-containing protein n=1 Tax=Grammatophora oceanica TaxID=210454 RepID=A0A7S1V2I9_9STRA|mmetsp:Transcript_35028/g.52073  ORF Transcript_35028/g.52073 Transcript_35028/m.52073 type:complete len:157 (+) Transcript_35028:135-605(+)
MSDQTATNKPSNVVLCKMGCGFFGSSATGDCCSKCFLAAQKKKGDSSAPVEECQTSQESQEMEVEVKKAEKEEKKVEDAMEVDEVKPVDEEVESVVVEKKPVAETPKKKKKKKKPSYKNMMAGMMKSHSPTRDIQQEKEALRNVTGGGAFSKIDKI